MQDRDTRHWRFPAPGAPRPPAGHDSRLASLVTATICYRDRPFDAEFAGLFAAEVGPALSQTGAAPIACLQTEYAENTFPALPVRTGEHVFVWFSRFVGPAGLRAHQDALEGCRHWQSTVRPALLAMLTGEPRQLTLAPTPRSLLR